MRMSITLSVDCKQTPLCWDKFLATKPPFSIALDGYVRGKPEYVETELGPYANFNHHEDVDALATRATCKQVLMAIRSDLFSTFRRDGEPYANVFVNDCDEDVCLAYFILKNHYLAQNSINPALNRLVDIEDSMDSTGGTYAMHPDMPILQELAWVFDPYRRMRVSGGLDRKNGSECTQVIEDVGLRIMSHIMGRGGSIPLDTRYEEITRGKNWAMVREIGANSKMGLISNGVKAFVSVRQRKDGRWNYVIGRTSKFVRFDVTRILNVLDAKEMSIAKSDDHWGGSNVIGGSPRVGGSAMNPETVSEIIRKVAIP